jgi:hypothetical protein
MKMIVVSLAVLFFLVSGPTQAFQSHPKPQKVAKHKTKGDHRHHWFGK